QSRFYVGCETSDDLPYIVEHAGGDNLVVGTDYGHADSATELLALRAVSEDKRLSRKIADTIDSDNARALYRLRFIKDTEAWRPRGTVFDGGWLESKFGARPNAQ